MKLLAASAAVEEVNDALDVPISQEQFDALVDFTFNREAVKSVMCIFLAGVASVVAARADSRAVVTQVPPPSICGDWVVSRYMTHGMAAAPRGKYLGIRASSMPSRMQFGNGVIVQHPLYRASRWSDSEFFQGYHSDMSGLGIKGNSVQVDDVLDRGGAELDGPGTELYVRNGSQIITYWDGVFYLLDRAGSACGGKFPGVPTATPPSEKIDAAVRVVKAAVRVSVSDVRLAVLIDFAYYQGSERFLNSTLLKTINAKGHVTKRMFTQYISRPCTGADRERFDRMVQDYYLYKDN